MPGVRSPEQRESVEEARDNLREALELFFEAASPEEVKQRLHREIFPLNFFTTMLPSVDSWVASAQI